MTVLLVQSYIIFETLLGLKALDTLTSNVLVHYRNQFVGGSQYWLCKVSILAYLVPKQCLFEAPDTSLSESEH